MIDRSSLSKKTIKQADIEQITNQDKPDNLAGHQLRRPPGNFS
jgi:hypothetical protein